MDWVDAVRARGVTGPWGVYLHVPYCATRCGYCDFNTYTAEELGPTATRATYADTLVREIAYAGRLLPEAPPVYTVFVGGGTPTLLGADDLVRALSEVRATFGLTPDAEVTVEANPDSVDPRALEALLEGGFTRISFGVQSLSPHVLRVLERTHTPGRSIAALREARQAGFEHVSADLIYATPGETDEDLRMSVQAVLAEGIDHLSAYSLIVEPGTRLAARMRRGEMPMPDDDVAADRYCIVDACAREAGMDWYEVSNWARPGGECWHNLGYWRGHDWWGAGPGAHGHIGGVRWWNVKHPEAYGQRIAAGESPVDAWEGLTADDVRLEAIMLGVRLREGLPTSELNAEIVASLIDEGLVEQVNDRIALTASGRLLADAVVRRLAD